MSTTEIGWNTIFNDIDPYLWAYTGTGLSIGLSILGAAWYISCIAYDIGAFLSPVQPLLVQVLSSLASSPRTLLGIV